MDRDRSSHASAERRRRPLLVALLLLGVLLLLLLAAGPAALAGPKSIITDLAASPSWTASVAGPAAGSDGATDVIMLKRDVILVLGTLSNAAGNTDISLTKYAGDVKEWTKVWNGRGDLDDTARKMTLSSDGKWVFICGNSATTAANSDLYVLKRSTKNGSLEWAKKYDGPAHKNELAVAIGVDACDNVVAAAWSFNATDLDYVVASWKSSGAKRWTWRWDGGGNDMPFDLSVEPNGKSLVTGAVTVAGKAATGRPA